MNTFYWRLSCSTGCKNLTPSIYMATRLIKPLSQLAQCLFFPKVPSSNPTVQWRKNFLFRISGATTEPSLPSESSKRKYSTNNWWCCISVRSLDVLPATSKSWCCFAFDTSSVIPNCVICGFQTCRDGGPSLWLLLLWCLCTILQPTLTKKVFIVNLGSEYLRISRWIFFVYDLVCEYRFTFLSWSVTI